jgi:hypothetical protein
MDSEGEEISDFHRKHGLVIEAGAGDYVNLLSVEEVVVSCVSIVTALILLTITFAGEDLQ